jgi:hypothetical protein
LSLDAMTPDRQHADALNQNGAAPSPPPEKLVPALSLSDYPELVPVISLALDAVVSSFYPEKIDDHFRAYLERVTTAATLAIYAPIAALTARVGRGAEDSRTVRTAEVARAAEDMATSVAKMAEALQTREEATAVTVARDASLAAELVAASDAFSDDQPAMAVTAAAVATAVHDAATAAVLERARAASLVAQSASAAASEVAAAADQATIAVELEVFQAAAALRGIALETCYQVAINYAASAAEAVLADGLPDQV